MRPLPTQPGPAAPTAARCATVSCRISIACPGMRQKPVRSGIHIGGDHNRRMSHENANRPLSAALHRLVTLDASVYQARMPRPSCRPTDERLHAPGANGASALAGFCSAKGRLQASFMAWRTSDADIILACSADLLHATLRRLSMFVLRMKCKLSDASARDSPVWPGWNCCRRHSSGRARHGKSAKLQKAPRSACPPQLAKALACGRPRPARLRRQLRRRHFRKTNGAGCRCEAACPWWKRKQSTCSCRR